MTKGKKNYVEFIYCVCGCGFTRSKYDKKGRLRNRIYGHVLRGKECSWFKGFQDKGKYILVYSPKHPFATKRGLVPEHRLVMEEFLGRYLTENEVVHHKDKNTKNNHISNLSLYNSHSDHMKDHLIGKVLVITKDMSGRYCLMCGSKTTIRGKDGYLRWSKYKDGFICNKCDCKKRRKSLAC